MNSQTTPKCGEITFHFNGQISINPECLKVLLAELHPEKPTIIPLPKPPASVIPPAIMKLPENLGNKRLAYTMRETAEILGVSYITVHRLIQRRLLKHSKALRKIIIPASEIERFLKETL